MLTIPEYDPDLPYLITSSEAFDSDAKWYRRQLKHVAGKNRFGGQNLELRWGVDYEDPMSTDKSIKYLDFTRHGKQFGERRWILEIWRSPEFLKRSGRYKIINDSDTVQEFYFCKSCGAEIVCDAKTLEIIGSVPPCSQCGSKRSRTELIREMGKGQLLQEFPSEGCYDYWLRLERANLTYHPPDNEALEIARALWQWELTPQNERDALEQADREIERRQMIAEQRRQMGGGIYTGAVNPFYMPR